MADISGPAGQTQLFTPEDILLSCCCSRTIAALCFYHNNHNPLSLKCSCFIHMDWLLTSFSWNRNLCHTWLAVPGEGALHQMFSFVCLQGAAAVLFMQLCRRIHSQFSSSTEPSPSPGALSAPSTLHNCGYHILLEICEFFCIVVAVE